MAKRTKSPLKFAPPRTAGQSLTEQLIDNAFDSIVAPYLVAILLAALATLECWRWYADSPPRPWVLTAIALVGAAWAVWAIRRGLARAETLRLGRDGERAVAHYLEWFRTRDFFVFHDVPTGDANIDHVLIGTRGVYVIETKTLSKPVRGDCIISCAEGRLLANGRALDRDPIVQAKAQARWLANFFGESKLKSPVQPVVVFPGWFIEKLDMKPLSVWVLEPKALDAFIDREPLTLSLERVGALASALSSYIRSQSRL